MLKYSYGLLFNYNKTVEVTDYKKKHSSGFWEKGEIKMKSKFTDELIQNIRLNNQTDNQQRFLGE